MSKRLKTALILLFTVFMVTTAFSVVASSLSEDDYLNGTQIKITTYPLNEQLTPDQNIYNIPVYIKNLLISSAELKTPYSSTFTTTWSCDYNKWISISQKSSSSSLLKINKRPTVEEGDQTVVIAQTVKNKSGDIIIFYSHKARAANCKAVIQYHRHKRRSCQSKYHCCNQCQNSYRSIA